MADERADSVSARLGPSYLRFDSVRLLVEHCRRRYGTDDVTTDNCSGELVVRVVRPDGSAFSALVVHLEGARAYLVRLP